MIINQNKYWKTAFLTLKNSSFNYGKRCIHIWSSKKNWKSAATTLKDAASKLNQEQQQQQQQGKQ